MKAKVIPMTPAKAPAEARRKTVRALQAATARSAPSVRHGGLLRPSGPTGDRSNGNSLHQQPATIQANPVNGLPLGKFRRGENRGIAGRTS